jgi:hypothetical protein
MNRGTETKTFFGTTKEERDARVWADEQKDVYIPMSNTLRQSGAGGWILTVVYRIRPAK